MMIKHMKLVVPIVAMIAVSGCSVTKLDNIEGTAIGAGVGAAAGTLIGAGTGQVAAVAAGAVIGGVAGNKIQGALDQAVADQDYTPKDTSEVETPQAVHQVSVSHSTPRPAPAYSNSEQMVTDITSLDDSCSLITDETQLKPKYQCLTADGQSYIRH
jgi:uncharacterized protein YcfJ